MGIGERYRGERVNCIANDTHVTALSGVRESSWKLIGVISIGLRQLGIKECVVFAGPALSTWSKVVEVLDVLSETNRHA